MSTKKWSRNLPENFKIQLLNLDHGYFLFLQGTEVLKCKENINQQVYQAVAKLGQRTVFLNQTSKILVFFLY